MKTNMRHFLLLVVLILCTGGISMAQDDPASNFASKVTELTEQFAAKVAELNAMKANGEISEEDFEEAVEEAAEALEDKIDELEDDLEEMLEGIEEEIEEELEEVIEIDSDSSKNKVKINLGKKQRKRTKSYFLLNFGPTYIMEGTIGDNAPIPSWEPWNSWSGNVGLVFSTRLGGNNSIAHVNYGLLWKFTYVEVSSDHRLSIVDGNPLYTDPLPYANELSESQLSRQSLVIPVQLRLAGSRGKSLNVMLGGYGGIRLYGFQDLEFDTMEGEDAELRLRDDYQTNLWQYGVTAAVGQRWWQLYADYELSNLFEDNPNYELNTLNAGIQFFF